MLSSSEYLAHGYIHTKRIIYKRVLLCKEGENTGRTSGNTPQWPKTFPLGDTSCKLRNDTNSKNTFRRQNTYNNKAISCFYVSQEAKTRMRQQTATRPKYKTLKKTTSAPFRGLGNFCCHKFAQVGHRWWKSSAETTTIHCARFESNGRKTNPTGWNPASHIVKKSVEEHGRE